MVYRKCFSTVLFLVTIQGLSAVKINVHGSVSMGREILSFLEHYAIKSQFGNNNRRSGSGSGPPMESIKQDITTAATIPKDLVTILVRSQSFCQGLPHCNEKMEKILSSYIVVLVKSLENILEKLFQIGPKIEIASNSEDILEKFHDSLKRYFTQVEDLIRRANAAMAITKDNVPYVWISVLKKMNALFQIMTDNFLQEQLSQKRMEVEEIRKLLTQKMVIASAAVEEKYVATLCHEQKICEKSIYATDTLYKVMKTLSSLSEDKIGDFMKDFAAALRETNFYKIMTDPIFVHFREVIENIADPHYVKVKGILKIILNTVELRLLHMHEDLSKSKTQDIYLFHAILSDLDHFYNRRLKFPFEDFQEDFIGWVKFDGHITPKLIKLFKEFDEEFALEPEELMVKLKNQVKTFLEITLEIDN